MEAQIQPISYMTQRKKQLIFLESLNSKYVCLKLVITFKLIFQNSAAVQQSVYDYIGKCTL